MQVTISIPTALRHFAGGNSSIPVEAATTGEALERLTSLHPELRKHLFDDKNELRSFVNVYLNDEDVRHRSGPRTPLNDGDTLMIVPSIAGGATPAAEVKDLPELSHEEIARYSRIQAILQPIEAGIVDLTSIIAWQCNARIGLNGLGRQEAVEMIVAEKKRQMAMSDRARYGEMPMGGKGDKNF